MYIDGCLSKCLDVETGVPQGSILGPLFYVILSNDLPDSIHDHHDHDENDEVLGSNPGENSDSQAEYNIYCKTCGGICCFADDSTYTVSDTNQNNLTDKLNTKVQQNIRLHEQQ